VPNALLSYGEPPEVQARCREILEAVAGEGGYVMDASAIVQNDARPENVRAMIAATREHGDYGGEACEEPPAPPQPAPGFTPTPIDAWCTARPPGVCTPWAEPLAALPPIAEHGDLARRVWEDVDQLAYTFVWHVLVSF
jgi:hypothetical protein